MSNNTNTVKLKEKTDDPKFKKYFIKEELLQFDEQIKVEYKNYQYPFTKQLSKILKHLFCGFLNSEGGRVYIGVNDDKFVKGIQLNYKQKDSCKLDIINMLTNFYPPCKNKKINVSFIPVKNEQNSDYINDLYVIRVRIFKGDKYKLYSTREDGFKCFKRLNGLTARMKSFEIEEELVLFSKLKGNNNENVEEEDESEKEVEPDQPRDFKRDKELKENQLILKEQPFNRGKVVTPVVHSIPEINYDTNKTSVACFQVNQVKNDCVSLMTSNPFLNNLKSKLKSNNNFSTYVTKSPDKITPKIQQFNNYNDTIGYNNDYKHQKSGSRETPYFLILKHIDYNIKKKPLYILFNKHNHFPTLVLFRFHGWDNMETKDALIYFSTRTEGIYSFILFSL